jgi:glycosyltransferase involved in cell wall biosynthesis
VLDRHGNADRRLNEPGVEPVDVLLLTLDAEIYLEKCLDSLYREVPVNKVIVVDGGSRDKTVEILSRYPRMEINVRPDIRTTGKCYEFEFARASTTWVLFMDADIELPQGWYDEMLKHRDRYDFLASKRMTHYEFWRVDPRSLDVNQRPMGAPWLARLDCFKGYHVDDDYMWGPTDFYLRQVAEKNGYKFGRVTTACHLHHKTDNMLYESDEEKRGRRLLFQEPTKYEIIDRAAWEGLLDKYRRGIVKYLEPEFVFPSEGDGVLEDLKKSDMEWVKKTNMQWYRIISEYKRRYPILWARRKVYTVKVVGYRVLSFLKLR